MLATETNSLQLLPSPSMNALLSQNSTALLILRCRCFPPSPQITAATPRRGCSFPVDVPELLEARLDGGKPLRQEALLALQPWEAAGARSLGACAAWGPEDTSSDQCNANNTGGSNGDSAEATASALAPRLPRCRRLDFSVRAAALLAGGEPPILPARLHEWVVQATGAGGESGEAWKLQLLQLLAADWLLRPDQAVQLLHAFDGCGSLYIYIGKCSD